MSAERAICTNADCHTDLSSSPEIPNSCPACGSELITGCPSCKASLAEMQDPWPVRCEKCGEKLRYHLKQDYFGVM